MCAVFYLQENPHLYPLFDHRKAHPFVDIFECL